MKAGNLSLVGALLLSASCTLVRTRDITAPYDEVAPTPGADAGTLAAAPATVDPPIVPLDAFATLDDPPEAHGVLCQPDDLHPNFPNDADMLTMVFCQDLVPGGAMPTPHGLADLQKLLGLDFKDPNGQNGSGGNPAFAMLGHSSALTARHIASISPTTFLFTPPPADGSAPKGQYAILAFDPGELFVEVAVNDLATGALNFYLVLFDKDCVATAAGCTPNDLLTPNLVTGWSNVRIYEASTTLDNTIFDCHVCHQPDSASSPFLRMQEIEPPFTHWFSGQTAGGRALLADYHAAHGTSEDYGGVPAAMLDQSDPSKLAAFLQQTGFGQQPNAFPSAAVESEVAQSQSGQPAVNVPPGQSATWQGVYDASVAGKYIAAPYHDVKVTDPVKLAAMTSAYRQVQAGSLKVLPDIQDVFLDGALRDIGFAPKLGLDGHDLVVQMCQQCHNANLDMTVTRERFLVDKLDQMSRDEKNLAIERLQEPVSTRLRMPPVLFRTITDDERQAMITELEQ